MVLIQAPTAHSCDLLCCNLPRWVAKRCWLKSGRLPDWQSISKHTIPGQKLTKDVLHSSAFLRQVPALAPRTGKVGNHGDMLGHPPGLVSTKTPHPHDEFHRISLDVHHYVDTSWTLLNHCSMSAVAPTPMKPIRVHMRILTCYEGG
jgi:hypothetical protein